MNWGNVVSGHVLSGHRALALECTGLSKNYGEGNGLFDFNLTVNRGEIFGLIGPNGSGKSTMIKLVLDLIRADAGSVRILGLDAHRDSVAVKRRIGYIPGELAQFPGVSARYVINLLAGLRGELDEQYVEELASRLSIDLDRKFEALSHGNKQKVAIIQAFMHRPDFYVLDEPTLGLDPLVQRSFRELIVREHERGATVLLSSHVLSEVESICTQIGVLKQGRLVMHGTLDELRQLKAHRVELVFGEPQQVETFSALPGVRAVECDGSRVRLEVQGDMAELVAALAPLRPRELDSRELTLEEVFYAAF